MHKGGSEGVRRGRIRLTKTSAGPSSTTAATRLPNSRIYLLCPSKAARLPPTRLFGWLHNWLGRHQLHCCPLLSGCAHLLRLAVQPANTEDWYVPPLRLQVLG